MYFCLFIRHGAPRDLHSFPTRRSSDLGRVGLQSPKRFGERSGGAASVEDVRVDSQKIVGRQADFRGRHEFPFAGRSEEHTSELQSRFDLVCRLLLEKKKKNITLMYP